MENYLNKRVAFITEDKRIKLGTIVGHFEEDHPKNPKFTKIKMFEIKADGSFLKKGAIHKIRKSATLTVE